MEYGLKICRQLTTLIHCDAIGGFQLLLDVNFVQSRASMLVFLFEYNYDSIQLQFHNVTQSTSTQWDLLLVERLSILRAEKNQCTIPAHCHWLYI